jgi:hypothetical protein
MLIEKLQVRDTIEGAEAIYLIDVNQAGENMAQDMG